MKNFAKRLVVGLLGWQVRRLKAKNDFKVIAVAGSVGKTSTKLAIATVLKRQYSLLYQDGNYNDPVSVPLIFFDNPMPSLFNPFAWLMVLLSNEKQITKRYPYEVVVVELGTDGPGQMIQFASYMSADITVLTAIAPEHMEFFGSLNAVAAEELSVARFSNQLLINTDLCAHEFLAGLEKPYLSYGLQEPATYQIKEPVFLPSGCKFRVDLEGKRLLSIQNNTIAVSQIYSLAAAIAVGHLSGMDKQTIIESATEVKAASGRMQQLRGVNNSLILDDTYNASPEAFMAAMQTLYRLKAPQKIAILGNMNELGEYAEQAHREAGEYCDPIQLDLVITLGPDANKYLAPAAKVKGCIVKQFTNPYDIPGYLKSLIKPGAVILAKGSQNRVYAEEAVKGLLADPADADKLVRQTPRWLAHKRKSFAD